MTLLDSRAYDDFWSRFFGLALPEFQRRGVHVVTHAHLSDYPGIWFFSRGESLVVSAPPRWVERVRAHAGRISMEPAPSLQLVREILGAYPARVIGPVYQGYLPPGAFCAVHDASVRRLRPSDEAALLDLRSACAEDEWEHSALSTANDAAFGYFCNGELVAAAGAEHWTPDSLSPGVLSRPDIRGRGMGTAVVSAVVESAIISGKIPLYQTLSSNASSIAVAEHLGYRQYGVHVAVRPHSEKA